MENVDSYKYLGLIFSYNGSFEKAINDLIKKCSRGTYLLNTALSNWGAHSAGLATELFDRQILPILNYGCLIWSLPKNFNGY